MRYALYNGFLLTKGIFLLKLIWEGLGLGEGAAVGNWSRYCLNSSS